MIVRHVVPLILLVLVLAPNSSFAQQGGVLLPYQQMANGVLPKNVVCPDDMTMIVKIVTNSPACVKHSSVSILVARHWGINPLDGNGPYGSIQQYLDNLSLPHTVKVSNSNFTVNYSITGAIITGLSKDPSAGILHISLQTKSDGSLTIEFPRQPFETKISGAYQYSPNLWNVRVLNDGQEVDLKDVKITDTYRMILIPFIQGTSEIQVIEGYPLQL